MRVLGDDEGRSTARRIRCVPSGDAVALSLRLAAAQANLRRSVDVELERRRGKNDRADVAAFHHQIVRLRITTEMIDQGLADARDAADERDVFVDAVVAQEGLGIDPVDAHKGVAVAQFAGDGSVFREMLDRQRVVRRNSALEHEPGHGAVHRARVDVNKAKTAGQFAGDAALARGGRTINRDDLMGRRGCHREARQRTANPPPRARARES